MLEFTPVGSSYDVMLDNKRIGSLYMEIDGYYVFSPAIRYKGGYWDEALLLGIGNQLSRLNKEWDESINQYFENNK